MRECTATYTDGRSAASKTVTVRLTPNGLGLTNERGTPEALWPLAELRARTAISRATTRVLLERKGHDGQTLWIQDGAFIKSLAREVPAITEGAHTRRWMGIGITLIFAAIVIGLTVTWLDLRPAQTIARMLPTSARASLGNQISFALTQRYGTCTDARGTAALIRMTQRVVPGFESNNADLSIGVLNWKIVNALTLPGGRIFLTRGLIDQAGGPDQVAGVLAHEVGHARALHPETSVVRALGLSALIELMAGGTAGSLSSLAQVILQRGYSRDAEREADAIALAMLRDSQISANGLKKFFEFADRQRGNASDAGRALEVLSTHPAPRERIKAINRFPTYDARPALNGADWLALRQICRGAIKPKKT